MITGLAPLITILTLGFVYYRVYIYDKWEAANSRIAKQEIDSIPRVPYEDRETIIFEIIK